MYSSKKKLCIEKKNPSNLQIGYRNYKRGKNWNCELVPSSKQVNHAYYESLEELFVRMGGLIISIANSHDVDVLLFSFCNPLNPDT